MDGLRGSVGCVANRVTRDRARWPRSGPQGLGGEQGMEEARSPGVAGDRASVAG